MGAKRRRAHDKLARLPGVRPLRRPVTTGSAEQFDLYYVRSGRKSAHPVVFIPGGPGVASVRQYRSLRRRMAAEGLDVIMIEHRGVGMSRHDDAGADLPLSALTIEEVVDDVAAVLDDAQVAKATLYGTSYGTYIAAGVGARHPQRVHAMVLDSPVLSSRDIDAVRLAVRGLLWNGENPTTAPLAAKVRRLVDSDGLPATAGQLALVVYGYGGPALLERQIDLLLSGRTLVWQGLDRAARAMVARKAPYRNEPDLVGRIGFRELNYADVPDGKPLDPAIAMRELANSTTAFEAEPFDLDSEMPKFDWPTAVLSGSRDLITPPSIAEQIAASIPGAALVTLPSAGHSIIDTRERAALSVVKAVDSARHRGLPAEAPKLDRLPGSLALRLMMSALSAAAAAEAALPTIRPLARLRVTHSN